MLSKKISNISLKSNKDKEIHPENTQGQEKQQTLL